jgi:hypothetical protein
LIDALMIEEDDGSSSPTELRDVGRPPVDDSTSDHEEQTP